MAMLATSGHHDRSPRISASMNSRSASRRNTLQTYWWTTTTATGQATGGSGIPGHLRSAPAKCSSGETDGRRAGPQLAPALLFEDDLTPGCEGFGGCASPATVCLGCSFESLDEKWLRTHRPLTGFFFRWSSQALPSPFESAGVEGRRASRRSVACQWPPRGEPRHRGRPAPSHGRGR
jgi:hypothetical protein